MLESQLEEKNKLYKNLKDEVINKYRKGINTLNIDNKKIGGRFLNELNCINSKTRPGTESQDKNRVTSIKNLTIVQSNEKNRLKIKSSLMKKNELSFPKINSVKNKNINEFNYFSIYNNNASSKWINNYGIINKDNNNKFFKKISLINNEEEKDNNIFLKKNKKIKEKNSRENSYKINKKNETINEQDKRLTIDKIPKMKKNTTLQKIKIIKSNSSNIFEKDNNLNSLMIHKENRTSKISNYLFQNKNLYKKIGNKPFTSPIFNELKELNSDKMKNLNNIFNILRSSSPLSFDGIIPIQKAINLNSEIYKNKYKNFKNSIISNKEDIKEKDYIKGYGYNSHIGNIREYNEDAITVTKIYFNNDKDNYCYYFGIFDGHGGKGCSNYIKENLHKNIKEFTTIGVKIGIDLTEERFKINEAVDEKGEIKDSSGSCGTILLIKDKKCIIANIGDSRLVIFKNKCIEFTTMDHKPNSIIEKARIEIAGGKIYKTPSLNEKDIEIPWRVLPGKLSVSRTFGDILAKDEKYGGNKTVIIALPDITEIELDDNYNFIVIGCDGIFDVLKNEELLDCIHIVIKERKIKEKINNDEIHELCGDFASMIIKSALTRGSFDNLSCIVIALNLNNLLPIN